MALRGDGNGGNGHYSATNGAAADEAAHFAPGHTPPGKANGRRRREPQHQPSLFRDPTIPALARWGLPVLLLANDALLLYSNIGDGATVHLRVFDGQGQAVDSAPLYAITLGHSIQDMWNAKAYFTSVLIAVFSGAWPHIKSLIAFLCWILDGRRLGQDARRALLTLAYVMQKLSHIETFVLVIMMVGGDIKFHLPQHDLWGLRSIIRPQAGFYCFLTGLCCSMLLSRLLLHYDYEATAAFEEAKEAAEEEEAEEMEEGFGVGPSAFVGASDGDGDCDGGELKEEAEERDGSGGDEQGSAATPAASAAKGIEVSAQSPRSSSCLARAKRLIDTLGVPSGSVAQDIATPYLLFALLAVLIVGLATPCFSFHYEGLFGWVLAHVTTNWPDVSPPVQISTVVSLGLSVPTATDTPDAFGVRYLQAAFLFFVVVAPVGCLLLLLAISLAPVRGGGELLTAAEVLYAWSAPDVLFIAMVTTTLEIGLFLDFALGDRCAAINAVLRAVFDKELHGDDVCIDIVAEMETGIWVYGSASLVLFLIGGLILRNRRREYAPYLKRARQRQTADRRRRASAEEEVASPRSLPIWRRSCGTATSTSAATVPLLSDGSGAEEETKVEHGSSVL